MRDRATIGCRKGVRSVEGIGYRPGLGAFRPNPPLTGSTWDDLVGRVYRREPVNPAEIRALADEAALYARGYTPRSDREWLEDVLETIDELRKAFGHTRREQDFSAMGRAYARLAATLLAWAQDIERRG